MKLAETIAARIDEESALEIFATPITGVVLRRPRDETPSAVCEGMEGAFVSLTQVGKETWFRSVAVIFLKQIRRKLLDSALSALNAK